MRFIRLNKESDVTSKQTTTSGLAHTFSNKEKTQVRTKQGTITVPHLSSPDGCHWYPNDSVTRVHVSCQRSYIQPDGDIDNDVSP